MLPILYSKTATVSDFQFNGLGFISTARDGRATETRNGEYELIVTVSAHDRLAAEIKPLALIKVKANPKDDPQIFEIYNVEKTAEKIVVKAEHIRYRLSGNVLTETYRPSTDVTPTQAWNQIAAILAFPLGEFTFSSDISSTGKPTAAASAPCRIGEFLLGKEGSLLDTYRGEYHFDNFAVTFSEARGQETGVGLRVGAGISDLSYEVSTDYCFSHVSPFARVVYRDADGTALGDIYITLADIVSTETETETCCLPYSRCLSYDFTEAFATMYPDFTVVRAEGQPYPTAESWAAAQNKLQALCTRYIRANRASFLQPEINMTIGVQKDAPQLRDCGLCDYVTIYYAPMDLELQAKIVQLTYDFISETVTSVELATVRRNLSRLFSDVNVGGL